MTETGHVAEGLPQSLEFSDQLRKKVPLIDLIKGLKRGDGQEGDNTHEFADEEEHEERVKKVHDSMHSLLVDIGFLTTTKIEVEGDVSEPTTYHVLKGFGEIGSGDDKVLIQISQTMPNPEPECSVFVLKIDTKQRLCGKSVHC